MTLYIFDTDHISFIQQGHPAVTSRMSTVKPDSLATTFITLEEQVKGRFNAIKRSHGKATIVQCYRDLQDTLDFFRLIHLLNFDEPAYQQFQTLRSQKISVGTQDLRIASIVLSIHGILVTRNTKDFQRIPELHFEDWTTE